MEIVRARRNLALRNRIEVEIVAEPVEAELRE